jgi:hypothetical protein
MKPETGFFAANAPLDENPVSLLRDQKPGFQSRNPVSIIQSLSGNRDSTSACTGSATVSPVSNAAGALLTACRVSG